MASPEYLLSVRGIIGQLHLRCYNNIRTICMWYNNNSYSSPSSSGIFVLQKKNVQRNRQTSYPCKSGSGYMVTHLCELGSILASCQFLSGTSNVWVNLIGLISTDQAFCQHFEKSIRTVTATGEMKILPNSIRIWLWVRRAFSGVRVLAIRKHVIRSFSLHSIWPLPHKSGLKKPSLPKMLFLGPSLGCQWTSFSRFVKSFYNSLNVQCSTCNPDFWICGSFGPLAACPDYQGPASYSYEPLVFVSVEARPTRLL